MKFNTKNGVFHLIGIKNVEKFEDYPVVIPKAVDEFRGRFEMQKDTVRSIVYEPKKGPSHDVGFFYCGALLEDKPTELPDGISYLRLEGHYAYARDTFDVTRMGEFYNNLDNWILQNKLERKDFTEELMFELYYPKEDGTMDLEVYMRIK
ncbi:hypothetical protein [Sutcliffiella rhizosphaerae]|uniref:AraC family transcriptional regulator n=1 Tax=Sutcliffiella rhizosphaerae TaxID=2880967 RepID=A0ABM8YRH7_9BACI|nr:hypothetical protein [Sutcliffiella rhizosphaerae]CAG9622558.1 hypothetical protein BACCIP111883_03349 [Sutcliffiella rhizosphaerae]